MHFLLEQVFLALTLVWKVFLIIVNLKKNAWHPQCCDCTLDIFHIPHQSSDQLQRKREIGPIVLIQTSLNPQGLRKIPVTGLKGCVRHCNQQHFLSYSANVSSQTCSSPLVNSLQMKKSEFAQNLLLGRGLHISLSHGMNQIGKLQLHWSTHQSHHHNLTSER